MRSNILRAVRPLALDAFAFTTLALAPAAQAQSFTDGDIYLVSAGLPGGAGIMRITPGTWATSIIYAGSMASFGRGTYDSFRDRIIGGPDGIGSGLTMVSAAGGVSHLPYAGPQDIVLPASAGDGRVYFVHNSNPWKLGYFDAANVPHALLESDGITAASAQTFASATYFDIPTSSLIIAYRLNGPFPHRIERLQLNSDGSKVLTRQSVDFNQGGSGEAIMGLSRGPAGKVFITIDDNSNAPVGRMALIDPVAMTVSTFAVSSYFGVGGEVAGCYSSTVSRAVMLDTLSDKLHLFAQDESGAGTVVGSGVSSNGGSGELAQLLEIFHATCPADFDGTGFVDTDDFTAFVLAFEAGTDNADFDHSGFVDTDDFTAFVLAFEAGC